MDRGPAATISSEGEITTLLHAWTDGDAEALSKLISLVYEQLHGELFLRAALILICAMYQTASR